MRFARTVDSRPWMLVVVAVGLGVVVTAESAWAQGTGNKASTHPAPPAVVVAEVTQQDVPVSRIYTGTTEAVKAVELQAQVTGYLIDRKFTEGSTVAAGDVLYIIDPAPFQAVLQEKQAGLREQEAILKYAAASEKRFASLARTDDVPPEKLDQAVELQDKTKAAVEVLKAEIEQAKINLDFTTIKAPFDGRVGRTRVNVGALVHAGETELTSLVQLDPIYVTFSPPETDLLMIEEQQQKAHLKVEVTLPHAGVKDIAGALAFIGNAADPATGTILMRATIPNPDLRIRPGQFALVHLHITDDPKALVVPAKALIAIQGQRFVMVVGKDNKLERRSIRLGAQVDAGSYVVEDGVSEGDLVVVSDTQTLRAGEVVTPRRVPAS